MGGAVSPPLVTCLCSLMVEQLPSKQLAPVRSRLGALLDSGEVPRQAHNLKTWVRIPVEPYVLGVVVAQELPNLLVWVRFLQDMLDTRWCNGSMRGSEPLGLGSNPGWVALEGSVQRWASGLESRAGCDSLGVRFLYFPLDCVGLGPNAPAKGV